jgi:hypothetical protein
LWEAKKWMMLAKVVQQVVDVREVCGSRWIHPL